MTNDSTNHHVPPWLLPAAQPFALRLAVVLLFVIAVGLSALRIRSVLHVPPADPEFTSGLTDFHSTVYFPALAFRQGFNPYSREYTEHFPAAQLAPYSPAMFWLWAPFSLLPLEVANVAYFGLTCALVIALAASVLAVCRVPLTIVNVFGLATLILISRPGYANMLGGQITLLPVLGALWALELSRRRPVLGGLALALTTLKPTFAIPMIWLMCCRRDFRTVFAGVLIGGIAALIGFVPLVANHGLRPVIESIQRGQARLEIDKLVATETTWTRVDTVALVGKLTGHEPQHITQITILAACLLAAGFALWKIDDTPLAKGADSLSALIICAATLACVYHANYGALLLVGPWVAVAVGRLREQLPPKLRALVWLLLTIPAINFISTRLVITRFSITDPLLTPLTMINGVCILAVLVLAIGTAVYAKPQPALVTSTSV